MYIKSHTSICRYSWPMNPWSWDARSPHSQKSAHNYTVSPPYLWQQPSVPMLIYWKKSAYGGLMQFKPMLSKGRLYTDTYMYVHTQKFCKWVTDFMHFRIFLEQGWESHTPWTPVSWDYITHDLLHWFKAWLSARCILFVSRQVTAFLPGQ